MSEVIFELFMILNHEKVWQTIILETFLLWDLEMLYFTQVSRLLLHEVGVVSEDLIIILFSIESRDVGTLGIIIILLLADFRAEDHAVNVHLFIIISISTCT